MKALKFLLAGAVTAALLAFGSAGALPPGPDGIFVDAVFRGCSELLPHAVSATGVTDDGRHVVVDVAVVLDDTTVAKRAALRVKAEEALAKANEAYAPINVSLRAASFTEVRFTSQDAGAIIGETKAYFGGQRPAGSDMVYTFIGRALSGTTAGQADCIGGVQHANEAFAVGGVSGSFNFTVSGTRVATFQKDATAKIVAHELAHLLGTHHHYSDCGVGAAERVVADDREVAPCSLMTVDLALIQLRFSPLDQLIVRAHALQWAD